MHVRTVKSVLSRSGGGNESSDDALPRARLVARLGRHAEVRDVADACECFAAEAVCPERREVLEGLDLGRGEALAKDRQVVFLRVESGVSQPVLQEGDGLGQEVLTGMCTHADAAAVVLDLEELEAAVFDRDADARCASIESVFDELFEGV